MTTIALIGSRAFKDPDYFIDLALNYHPDRVRAGMRLVSGGARNVDQKAEKLAAERKMSVVSLRPVKAGGRFFIERIEDGKTRGLVGNPQPLSFETFRDAAFERNWMIANLAEDGVTAIWDGVSAGTAHGIACAVRLHRAVTIWMPGDSGDHRGLHRGPRVSSGLPGMAWQRGAKAPLVVPVPA